MDFVESAVGRLPLAVLGEGTCNTLMLTLIEKIP